jgi:hypothetical protein
MDESYSEAEKAVWSIRFYRLLRLCLTLPWESVGSNGRERYASKVEDIGVVVIGEFGEERKLCCVVRENERPGATRTFYSEEPFPEVRKIYEAILARNNPAPPIRTSSQLLRTNTKSLP